MPITDDDLVQLYVEMGREKMRRIVAERELLEMKATVSDEPVRAEEAEEGR